MMKQVDWQVNEPEMSHWMTWMSTIKERLFSIFDEVVTVVSNKDFHEYFNIIRLKSKSNEKSNILMCVFHLCKMSNWGPVSSNWLSNTHTKGQLNSEWIHEVIVSPKMPTKTYVLKIIPMFVFWENWVHHNLLLRLSDLYGGRGTRYNLMKWHISSWLFTKLDDFLPLFIYIV